MSAAQSVIVYGPPGCGKTRNAKRIARYFRLKHVIDDDRNRATSIYATGILYLMQAPPVERNGARCIPFAQVIHMIRGIK